jgi:hypothetical protein
LVSKRGGERGSREAKTAGRGLALRPIGVVTAAATNSWRAEWCIPSSGEEARKGGKTDFRK